MNCGELKTALGDFTHRSDLSSNFERFIRQAEGFIARELRAAEMIKRVELDETDRDDGARYTLPTDYLEERALYNASAEPLTSVSLAELRKVASSASVRHYTVISSSLIEFRGKPGTDATVELIYFARPAALSDDADENDILTRHEAIYLYGAAHFLYVFTQDLELAENMARIAQDAIDTLNEQAGRLIGGARTQGGYELSSWGAY